MNTHVPGPPSGDGGLPLSLSGNRVSRGTPARWTETTGWRDRDGLPIPDTLLVIGYTTVLRRWQNKKPSYITEHPLPDPDELNAVIPVEEWENGLDGKPSKPWKTTYVIYMVDLKTTGALFTYEHDTFGAMLCYTNLEEARCACYAASMCFRSCISKSVHGSRQNSGCRCARICNRQEIGDHQVVSNRCRHHQLRKSADRRRRRRRQRRHRRRRRHHRPRRLPRPLRRLLRY